MLVHPFRRAALAAASFVALSPQARADSTVVVTGSREPLSVDRLAADVVVIDADTIRRSTADSLADLLRREAGLQLSRNGGPGQNSALLIRGGFAGQTVLLVDGVRIGSATLGQPPFEGLGLDQIERIEVLRGPGSSIYGADAMGGVVQVFTRRGAPGTSFDAHAAVGGYDSQELSFGASGGTGAWDGAASVSRERSRGVSALRPGDQFGNYNPDTDGYALDAAQAQLGFKPAPGQRIGLVVMQTRLDSHYDGGEFPPPAFVQDSTPDFRTKLKTEVAALDWRGDLGTAFVGSARLARSVDDSTSGGNLIDRFRTDRSQATAQLAWNTGSAGQLVGALEHVHETASSTTYLADVARRTNAAVLSWTGSAAIWSWQADARRDDSSDYGGVTTGRLGGGVTVAPGVRLRALAGTTFRAPSFNELYYPGYGVRTLQPERGRSIEFGATWRGDSGDAAATVYRNRVKDLIGFEGDPTLCPPGYVFGCARNTDRALLEGATFSASHRRGALRLSAQIDFLNAKDEATGARLQRRAAHQESFGADWDGGSWSIGAAVLDVGARPDAGKELAAETTLDLKAAWRFAANWTLEAKLLNATDRDIEPARDYQGLGRQGWIGVRWQQGR